MAVVFESAERLGLSLRETLKALRQQLTKRSVHAKDVCNLGDVFEGGD